ncbi:MAG: bifunctional 5,10-methylenetetrahydrofolate dehydrogenase/5,10-methenyltetrahydrofolate cyclohydrolase [Spirochaetia bacterium]
MQVLSGKIALKKLYQTQQERIAKKMSQGIALRLDIILIATSLEQSPYVLAKKRACENLGIHCHIHRLDPDITQATLCGLIDALNADPQVRAIICQLPLPAHIDIEKIVSTIDKHKDIDGFHPQNLGKLALGHPEAFIPCTPAGILYLFEFYNIPLLKKHVVILGRSRIVGLPLHLLLSQKKIGSTVTLCHSQTPNLPHYCKQADILIAAMGQPGFVQKDWIAPHCVVIDVGITRIQDPDDPGKTRLVGDVCPDAMDHVAAMTPVPGGVGPLTVAMVIENCLKAWER